ncbi:hypothetical protein X975_19153, partial [Stegodyphus mimosarum]
MFHRNSMFLCLCIVVMQLLESITSQHPLDPEVRAELEAKVISSMSLKELEDMVEQDERVRNAPKSRIVVVPKSKVSSYLPDGNQEAYVIHRKPQKHSKKATANKPEERFADSEIEGGLRRSSFEPDFRFESAFKYDEEFPSLFRISDLESADSNPVKSFYESIVEKVLRKEKFGFEKDPLAVLDIAASENVQSYQPRFDYESYSRDPTETKLKGKTYWKEAPERREEKVDENGCRTVVKKIMDPEDEKKSSSSKAKSVVITKECEYPSIDGPDAKIPEIQPAFRAVNSRLEAEPSLSYDSEPATYQNSRPVELDMGKPEARDPLAPDYIDRMLETHFRSFPGFTNPITSFKGYQDRFNLRTPTAFKDIKPTVNVHSYEYTHPQSGFEESNARAPVSSGTQKDDAPRTYEHHYHYDYPEESPRKAHADDYDDKKATKSQDKATSLKEPKMVKKSFAYYRKDNPKEDPNEQQYAEEYAQG